jgi:hypothetical protein
MRKATVTRALCSGSDLGFPNCFAGTALFSLLRFLGKAAQIGLRFLVDVIEA